ncbi:hypothetical protein [Aequorivita lipolytica]|uniref:Uncharacterized protein n=1 Tax=Aequorivita lipolytica TaxID=153267 RepID=A0A5C6YUG5_9FLAO|nr:hypothetical protein [Aequorivita lipolytica]TXD70583.1 hypothetical protein ESV24_00380 [Aequorivita lipolytica]SRX49615.1 hypothetical protein AEQU2_00078 [Aequorivita lipolytica]
MFGIKEKINDDSLYMLNDMVENQVINSKKELSELSPDNEERIEFLTTQIKNYETELERFKASIEKQLKERFQFSIEELYAMYGQYENKYISIEFHKFSESASKFGRNIAGVIIYQKKEREELEKALSEETVPRTNAMVKLDCSKNEKLSDEQKAQLLKNGFKSGDVYEVLASNMPLVKSYNQAGKKEIPNTMDIKFDSRDMDINHTYLYLFSQRIKNGGKLIAEEWAKFCGIGINFEPSSADSEIMKIVAFDEEGNLKPLVRFYELEAKFYSKNISKEEIAEFNTFLKQRREIRTEQIRKEIKRSTNKTLEKFQEEYPEIYSEIQKSIIQFDTETLYYHDTVKPIYWNYESYLHIYLRHCDELEIEGHFEDKTKFQYNQKDIRRILKIAIENLKDKINERLTLGKEFRIWDDKALYFNGNHYSIHILKDGRVASFHPMENPKE